MFEIQCYDNLAGSPCRWIISLQICNSSNNSPRDITLQTPSSDTECNLATHHFHKLTPAYYTLLNMNNSVWNLRQRILLYFLIFCSWSNIGQRLHNSSLRAQSDERRLITLGLDPGTPVSDHCSLAPVSEGPRPHAVTSQQTRGKWPQNARNAYFIVTAMNISDYFEYNHHR